MSFAPHLPVDDSSRRQAARRRLALVAALCALAAVAIRWGFPNRNLGERFQPRPDALEYAAGAQAIAQAGSYYLQVGPVRERPRYSPGMSLLLAPAVRLGVPGEALWRVSALFGGALAAIVALLAARIVGALGEQSPAVGRGGPLFAAGVAGGLWAISPTGVITGLTVMSDEAAAFFSLAALLTAVEATAPGRTRRGVLSWAGCSGLLFGVTAAVRPTAALLLVSPLLIAALLAFRQLGRGAVLQLAGAACAGLLLPVAVVSLLLVRSPGEPFSWTAYSLWLPEAYGEGAAPFRWTNALRPGANLDPASPYAHTNLDLAVHVLLGLPGAPARGYAGLWWPLVAWAGGLALALRARRAGEEAGRRASAAVLGIIAWAGGHVVLFATYFFQTPRFYLAPLALACALCGALVGVGWAKASSRAARGLIVACALTLLPLSGVPLVFLRFGRNLPEDAPLLRQRFVHWVALSDQERARRSVPFDPVEAQALGLLPPEVADRIGRWGELPDDYHVHVLRRLGRLPRGSASTPAREEQ